MHSEHQHDPQLSLEKGYEVSDLSLRVVLLTGAVLALSIVASVIAGVLIVRGLDRRSPMNTTPSSALTAELRLPPAGALLQTDPVGEKKKILAEATARLNSYGMVDENPTAMRAHVPVNVAMDLIAEAKVPYRQKPVSALLAPAPAPQPAPAVSPSPSTGGASQ
ncbi:MAG: hypothetical protein HYV26_18880 [Candidatus Hydrogenedentes bacterium]|nr:hypothetical protein [Candidatus Hydrogenedentota bacterium]